MSPQSANCAQFTIVSIRNYINIILCYMENVIFVGILLLK